MRNLQIKMLGCICIVEIVGTIGVLMGYQNAFGGCIAGTVLLTFYVLRFTVNRAGKKYCPECNNIVSKRYRICPHCGYLFANEVPEEQLTDYIEKEKEEEMTSEQIDKAFERVDTVSIEEANMYDSELEKIFGKNH